MRFFLQRMAKNKTGRLFYLSIFINIIWSDLCAAESEISLQRQKMILSLSRDLHVKNIILFKLPSTKINSDIILFARSLFESNIYFSFLNSREIQLLIDEFSDSRVAFSKSLVLTFTKELNDEIFKLITRNEENAYKFLWLVWDETSELISRRNFYNAMDRNNYFNIPYNTQLLIVENGIDREKNVSCISEIYHPRIYSRVMFTRRFGTWSESKGIDIPEKDIYKRRFDMNGTELIIIYNPDKIVDPRWKEYFGDAIINAMNFRYVLYPEDTPDKERIGWWEIYLRSTVFSSTEEKIKVNQWSDLIGFMAKAEMPMYIRRDELAEDYGISQYTRPFSKGLWLAIIMSVVFDGMCTALLLYVTNRAEPSKFDFFSALLHPLEAFTNQFGSEDPETRWIKLMIISARFAALFIVPAYSTFLLSYILNPNVKLPFTSIEEFVQDGSYKMAYTLNTNFENTVTISGYVWLKMAYEKYSLKPSELPRNEEEVREKICQLKKTLVIFSFDKLYGVKCQVVKIPKPIFTAWYAYMVRKGSPFTRIFNRIFKTYLSSGRYAETDRNWYFYMGSTEYLQAGYFQNKEGDDTVEIKSVAPIFQLMVMLYIISVMILFLECFFKRFKRCLFHLKDSLKC